MTKLAIYPQQKQAIAAIHAARVLWPGPIARVLEEEIMATYEFLSWMGEKARTRQLIEQILTLHEQSC
jgi:hypothetical protein